MSHHTDHATALTTVAADQATTTANAKLLARSVRRSASATTAETPLPDRLRHSSRRWRPPTSSSWARWPTGRARPPSPTLEPVEAQHAVVWGQMLDLPTDQWMPSFQSVSGSYDPATYAAELSADRRESREMST